MKRDFLKMWAPEGGASGAAAIAVSAKDLESEFVPPGYELVDDQAAPGAALPAEIEAEFKALKARNADLAARQGQTDAFSAALAGLSSKIEQVATRPVNVQASMPAAVVDPAERAKAFNDSFLEDPMGKTRSLVAEEFGGAFETMFQGTMNMAKALVRSNPAESAFFTSYGKEIDAELEAIPVKDRARDAVSSVERALSVVKARHLDDIMAQAKARWQEEQQGGGAASAGGQAPQAPGAAAPRGVPSSVSLPGSPRAPQATEARTVTKAQLERAKAIWNANGQATELDLVIEMVKAGEI